MDNPLGSGGSMLSCGVQGDNLSMKSIRSNGLAGATRLNLAKPGFLDGLTKEVVREIEIRGAGEYTFRPRLARDRLKDGIETEELKESRKLAVVGESFRSIDASLSSASGSSRFVRSFNLLLILGN